MPCVTFRSEFPPFSVTCDLVVLSVRAGALHVLLVTRGGEPYAGRLALPGGFVEIDENLEDAAYRELGEEAGVGRDDVILEQLAAFGEPGRDPRSPVVSALSLGVARGSEELAFDHGLILAEGVERARAKLEDTGHAAALCGERVTVADLHAVYEAVWGIELDRANFHRKVTGVPGFLTPTGEVREGGRGRPARVYRGDPQAVLSPPILRGDR